MSSYNEFVAEREKIDFLIEQGYKIKTITEDLSGAFVEFERSNEDNKKIETLHILTADARKYFSALILKQN